jgi:protoporphyrinogen IX oxidase
LSFLAPAYLWLKAFHILAVIAWMAGLLYLPRLYVYHAVAPVGSEQSETFKVMERRLLRGIMNPAMIATYLFGLLLAATPGIVNWDMVWIWIKLTLVVALTVFHMMLVRWRRLFAGDCNSHSARFYRMVNELPALAAIAIVIFVVVKPF